MEWKDEDFRFEGLDGLFSGKKEEGKKVGSEWDWEGLEGKKDDNCSTTDISSNGICGNSVRSNSTLICNSTRDTEQARTVQFTVSESRVDVETDMFSEFAEFEQAGGTPEYNKGVILGQAGTGKSTLLRNRITENKRYGLLCATTGIAALNLSTEDNPVATINSVLGYFDTEDMRQSYGRGKLQSQLLGVAEKYNNLIPDEMSMMGGEQFTILNRALEEVNRYKHVQEKGGLGLIVVGDFLQLPPVKDKFIFETEVWSGYERGIEKLTKIHRQTDPIFLEALQAARGGDGEKCASLLYSHPGVTFVNTNDYDFPGTTIYATNEEVDRHNKIVLDSLYSKGGKGVRLASYRWGKENRDWKNIPRELEICDGAYVMILNNYREGLNGELVAANGSKGWVRDIDGGNVTVQLEEERYGVGEMTITPIKRKMFEKYVESKHGPIKSKLSKKEWREQVSNGEREEQTYTIYLKELTESLAEPNRPYYDYEKEMMVVGEIRFVPLRLAYATTCHKSQGLTLTNCQIDLVGSGKAGYMWMHTSGLAYVALSRVRQPEGLRIVGSYSDVERKTNISRRVLKWI